VVAAVGVVADTAGMRAAGRHAKPSDTLPVVCAVGADAVVIALGVTSGLDPLAAGIVAAVTAVSTLVAVRGGTRARHQRRRSRPGSAPVADAPAGTVVGLVAEPGARPSDGGPGHDRDERDDRADRDDRAADRSAPAPETAGSLADDPVAPPPAPAGGRHWDVDGDRRLPVELDRRSVLLFESSALLAQLRWEYGVRHRSRVWIEEVLPQLGAAFDDEVVARDVLAACALNAGALDADLWIVETTAAAGALDVAAEQLRDALRRLLARYASAGEGDAR
jgi:hypothetical protein